MIPLNEVGFLARLGFRPWLTKKDKARREQAWKDSEKRLAQMRGLTPPD